MTLVIFLLVQKSPENGPMDSLSQNKESHISDAITPTKNSEGKVTPIKDKERSEWVSLPINNTSTKRTQNKEKTWPIQYKEYHNKKYPKYKEGSAFIRKHVSYFHYRALNEQDKDRLHEFSQYASKTLPLGQKHTIPEFCWATGGNQLSQSTFSSVRSAAIFLESQSDQGESSTSRSAAQGTERWTSTATDGVVGENNNNPVTITWSFVPDGTTIPQRFGGTTTSDLISKLNSTYGAPTTANDYRSAPWFELFETAFNYWGDVTGNVYVYEPNDDGGHIDNINSNPGVLGLRGDVRISGSLIDGNSSENNTLAFNYFPNVGDMVIDTADSINFANNEATKRSFRNMLAHEHGHGLGLSHACPLNGTKLMEPTISTNFTGPQFDDILSAVNLYGDIYERNGSNRTNDSTPKAHELGDILTSVGVDEIALSGSFDADYFKFKVNRALNATITVTPTHQGEYLKGYETEGSCSGGSNFNPATRQTLKVRLIDTDGITLLSESIAPALGSAAVISEITVPSSTSDYFIEVTGHNTHSSSENYSQIYSLSVNLSNASDLIASNFTIDTESNLPLNSAIDPDETITSFITLTNSGSTTIVSPVITLESDSGLSILDNASHNLPALEAGDSTTAHFRFKQTGAPGSQQHLVFKVSDGVNNSTFEHSYKLGFLGIISSQGFEYGSSLPSGWSQSTTAGNGWNISTASADSGTRSMFSERVNNDPIQGEGNINSAFLVSEEYNVVSDEAVVSFRHSYDFEVYNDLNSDGGLVEISIDDGVYHSIESAGGTISGHTYTGTVSTGLQSPLEGQSAWVGNSGGFVTTIINLPTSAKGKTIRLRWHHANDNLNIEDVDGWYIDNVVFTDYTSADTSFVMQIAATDPIASETTASDTGLFTISAERPVIEDTQVNYSVSGSATNGVDYEFSGSALISSGQISSTLSVSAFPDIIEDNGETVIVTLTHGNGYTIGVNSNATVTIIEPEINSYSDFHTIYFSGETINTGEADDFDGDGYSNLEEYALSLNPTLNNYNVFRSEFSRDTDTLSLQYIQDTNLADISIVFEKSTTLVDENSWTSSGIDVTHGIIDSEGRREVTGSVDTALVPKLFIRIKVIRN